MQWKGYKEHIWDPLMNFLHRYSSDLWDYVTSKELKFDLCDYMAEDEKCGVAEMYATVWRGW